MSPASKSFKELPSIYFIFAAVFMNKEKKHIAIFASGTGTNAARIITPPAPKGGLLEEYPYIVKLIICNKPKAGVLKIAAENNIPYIIIDKEKFFKGDAYLPEIKKYEIDLLVLAGFLWKIPSALIEHYPKRIINIHPALLPKYGGKGMYGDNVHQAVINAGDTESGITIHFVDEIYDHGQIILQANCPVLMDDTQETLAQRIHQLEYRHFVGAIKLVCGNL